MTILACEALATKAEVQELKNQINQLLGAKETNESETIDVLQAGTLEGTMLAAGLTFGLDIVEDTATNIVNVYKEGFKGAKKQLTKAKPFLTKVNRLGKGLGKVAGVLLEGNVGLMLDIANIAALMAMFIEVQQMEGRLKDAERELLQNELTFNSLYDIIEKAEGQIGKAQQNIDQLTDVLTVTVGNVETLKKQVKDQKNAIVELQSNLDIQAQNVETLQQDLENLQEYSEGEITELKEYTGNLKYSLDKHIDTYKKLNLYVSKLKAGYDNLDKTTDGLLTRFEQLSLVQTAQHIEIQNLYNQFQTEKVIRQSAAIVYLKKLEELEAEGGGVVSIPSVQAIAEQQKSMVDLASAMLGNPDYVTNPDTGEEIPVTNDFTTGGILNGDDTFGEVFKGLLAGIPNITNLGGEIMTPEQMEQLLNNWGTTFNNQIAQALENIYDNNYVNNSIESLVTPKMNDIFNGVHQNNVKLDQVIAQTALPAIAEAVGHEICNQANNPTSCLMANVALPILDELAYQAGTLGNINDQIYETGEIINTLPVEIDFSGLLLALDQIFKAVTRNYNILGGSFWETGENVTITPKNIKSEALIRGRGLSQYSNLGQTELEKETPITNILDFIESYVSICYHRSGYHRLPATLIESLVKPSGEEAEPEPVIISDQLSFQEWSVKQLDALFGQFPLKFTYKTTDENGDKIEQVLEIANTSEALIQILGLLLTNTENSETTLNAVMRCLVEARSSANAAIAAYGYAKGNADYLGYKGNQKTFEVDLSFTPGAKTMADTLKPSKQKITQWECEDKENLNELVKKGIFSSEIVKAALFIPFTDGGTFTGDGIKGDLDKKQQASDQEWETFKNLVNNPTGQYKVDKPTAKIKDLTIETEPTNDTETPDTP